MRKRPHYCEIKCDTASKIYHFIGSDACFPGVTLELDFNYIIFVWEVFWFYFKQSLKIFTLVTRKMKSRLKKGNLFMWSLLKWISTVHAEEKRKVTCINALVFPSCFLGLEFIQRSWCQWLYKKLITTESPTPLTTPDKNKINSEPLGHPGLLTAFLPWEMPRVGGNYPLMSHPSGCT